MRKLIDIKEDVATKLKVMAAYKGKDLKNFIQDELTELSEIDFVKLHKNHGTYSNAIRFAAENKPEKK